MDSINGVEFTELALGIIVIDDGTGKALGIAAEQIDELILSDPERRAELVEQWRTEAAANREKFQ